MVKKLDSARASRSRASVAPTGERRQAAAQQASGYQGQQLAESAPWPDNALAPCGVTLARLRHEEEQAYYNELYLLAPVGYFLVGFDGTILQANLAGADMLGIPRIQTGQHRFRSFIDPSCLDDFDPYFSKALNTSKPKQCRLLMTQVAGGAPFGVTLLASADGSGQACRIVVERAGRQSALQHCEERFRRMVHSAQEGIWEIDAGAHTSFVNPKMAAMLGYHIEEMLGRPLASFMDEEGKRLMDTNLARRRSGIAERHHFKFVHKDGHAIWTSMATNPIFDGSGAYLGALALVSELDETHPPTELMWEQASFDAVTGLPNRLMLMDRLQLETRKAQRQGSVLALLSIDLDHFKALNERHGRAVGDQVLVEATRRLAGCMRGTDMLACLGGDQFCAVLAGLDQVGSVERVAASMLALLALPFNCEGHSTHLSASIGVALYQRDASELDTLLAQADQAMHAARHQGRNCFAYANPALQEAAIARRHMAADLERALATAQFEVLYQPIVSLESGEVVMAEALLRWRHPLRGLLEPAEFLPFAETTGQSVRIGDWLFHEAARQLGQWQTRIAPGFKVCINQSPLQFARDPDALVQRGGSTSGRAALRQGMVIELKEDALLGAAGPVLERLDRYRALGMQVALDDFGAGLSSLAHLKRFGFDYVKIDRATVAAIDRDEGDLALCEAIIAMAHKLGLKVIAEGVETALQRALLADAGCDYAQGYWFAQPLAAADFDILAAALVNTE